jgi:MinD-like ATPase involved in chromosome partitioning or flagellar assembly
MSSDKGSPFVIDDAKSPAAKAFTEIVNNVEAYLSQREKGKTQ